MQETGWKPISWRLMFKLNLKSFSDLNIRIYISNDKLEHKETLKYLGILIKGCPGMNIFNTQIEQ